MRLYYRISDKSYEKTKLIGATKEACLMNFCKAFAQQIFGDLANTTGKWPEHSLAPPQKYVPPLRVIADRCERKTIKMVMEAGLPVTVTDLGNAGSLRKAIDIAMSENNDDELVYFCEDDYLHLGTAPKLLEEGSKRAEYVTLYDHPDKYTRIYNGGEFSKVIRTASSHWRYTASTCMTFGTKVKWLKEDKDIWAEFTDGTHPHDHEIFTKLGKKGRRLAVAIPGAACHTDLTFSGQMGEIMMEPWAVQIMIEDLEAQLIEKGVGDYHIRSIIGEKTGWQKLVALDALRADQK